MKADLFLAVFKVRNEAPVHTHMLGHVHLCPSLPFTQGAYPLPELNTNVTGHARNYGCRL
jgi:hypothetical protein